MKKLAIIFCFQVLATSLLPQQSDFSKLTGPYLGQKPPGMTPEVFAPEIVSREGHQAKLFFNSDGSEAIYDERDPVNNKNHFIWMRSIRGVWSNPVVIPFSTEYINNEPCLSPDGNKLFFVSNRPATPGGEAEKTPDIWMSERKEDGWGEPLRLGPAVNTPEVEVQPSFSSDGKLYFMRQSGSGRQLLCASFQDGQFLEPTSPGGNISTDQVSGPCISPDNRVLILHSRMEGGFGNWDLYASFKDASGSWGKLINLGKTINSEGSEGNATFSQDGKLLFFTRDGDIFWVSSKIIEELKQSYFPGLAGSYLGQKPPGMTPEIFAPGFISTKEYGELNSVFSNNGKEFYFSRRGVPGKPSTIMFTKLINGTWSIPEMVNFSGKKDDIDLFITSDGMSMIFCSDEINPGNNKSYPDHNFWISDREGEKWSDPVPFATEAASEFEDYFPIVTQSGNLYFNSQRSGPGTNDIYCSKYINGSYHKPEKMPAFINTSYREFDAFVSQDETIIIFSSDKPGGYGRSDLYISMKRNDGSWSEPCNLGATINSGFSEYGATITPDGKYLFFTSDRNGSEDIFWVSAKIIEELNTKE